MELLTRKKEKINLLDQPLGQGGEGNVYEVISPQAYLGYVAKIYHKGERNPVREAKIQYLIENRPPLKDSRSVIWPEEMLYENGEFVGFLMLKAQSAFDLTALCAINLPAKLGVDWRRKFSRSTKYGLHNRLQVCFNIAKAIEQIHKTNKYVLIDSKPENIKVDLFGNISIIDIDSVEIINENQVVFPAEKASPEYSPAERKTFNVKYDFIHQSWDRFSMGVVFYKVLFGLHPYTGTCKKPYDKLDSNEAKIQKGLFPHGPQAKYFSVIPEPHLGFFSISREVQNLFTRCFNDGHLEPSKRPSALEWANAFKRVDIFEPINYIIQQENHHRSPRPAQREYKPMIHTLTVGAAMIVLSMFSAMYLSTYKMSNFQMQPKIQVSSSDLPQTLNKKQIDEKYGFVDEFSEGLARTSYGDKKAYIDETGKKVTEFVYDHASNFHEGKARVGINDRFGFIESNGSKLTSLKYDWVGHFSEGYAKVRMNGKTGFINDQNQLVIPMKFERAGDFKEGLARIRIDRKWGFVNPKGQLVVYPQYKKVHNFHEGLAAVQKDNKWGFINAYGQVVIPIKYYWVTSFADGFAMVRDEKSFSYINLQGKHISSEEYKKINPNSPQKFTVKAY